MCSRARAHTHTLTKHTLLYSHGNTCSLNIMVTVNCCYMEVRLEGLHMKGIIMAVFSPFKDDGYVRAVYTIVPGTYAN